MASTSAQDKSGEDAGVYCDEVFIKAERDEDDDEVEFITEKDYFKEEDNFEEEECNYPGVCNEIQESEEEEEEQKYVGGAIGSAVKKEFEAVVTEVFLPPVKEELEEDFEPAGRDPLEDSPIRMTEEDVPESEETVTSQECRRIPMNILKFGEAENPSENWKPGVMCPSFETDYKPQDKGDLFRKAVLLVDIDSAPSIGSYNQASSNKSRYINSNMSNGNLIKYAYGTVGHVVSDNAPMSLVSSGYSHGMNVIQTEHTNSNNDPRVDVTNLPRNDSKGMSVVFKDCLPVLRNDEGMVSPVATQDSIGQCGSMLRWNNTAGTKVGGDSEELNLKEVHEGKYWKNRFKRIFNLKFDKRLRTGNTSLTCKWCGMSFTQNESLEAHDRLHIGETVYKCFLCAKVFLRDFDLTKHMVNHRGALGRECEFCGKCYYRNTELQEHLLTHSKKEGFPCKVCGVVFTDSHDLKIHMFSHKRLRPHECEICHKRFMQLENFKKHLEFHHKDMLHHKKYFKV